jgi:hypothetical protein
MQFSASLSFNRIQFCQLAVNFSIAYNGKHCRWQGIQCTFSPEPKLNKELKVQNKYKSSSKNFQPELQPNSELKTDEMYVSPAICACYQHVPFRKDT